MVMGDKGYQDNRNNRTYFVTDHPSNNNGAQLAYNIHQILLRHETVNKRLKNFNILKHEFRNDLSFHPIVFGACVKLVQICLNNGEQLYQL